MSPRRHGESTGSVTPEELQAISDGVGELKGWDFSRVHLVEEPPPWRYEDVVRGHLAADSVVLDLGTGGGELFSQFAAEIARGYGIDAAPARLSEGTQELSGCWTLAWLAMDAGALAFPDGSFDLVLASFTGYDVAEVVRVLRPGGVFVTQQIGDRDTQNIFDAFGWGSYGAHWRERYAAQGNVYRPTVATAGDFESAGCEVLRYDEYDTRAWHQDTGSLVFYLKASPLPQPFDPETHAAPLTALIQASGSERGIETNCHRELLVVRK
jgi:SAM-dependent methyltransferase